MNNLTKTTILALFAIASTFQTAAHAAGDAKAGKKLAHLCDKCHADDPGTPSSMPLLNGQIESYLVKALDDYRQDRRDDTAMQVITMRLNARDSADVAAYYAGLPPRRNPAKGEDRISLGRKVFQQGKCHLCHGEQAEGNAAITPVTPMLRHQNKEYLAKRLMDFQKGAETTNTPMDEVVKELSIIDIFAVTEYLNGM